MNSIEPSDHSLTIIVLTLNEERHIRRCLINAQKIADHIIVVDSGSTDKTTVLAREMGARVLFNPWINHAHQVNWVLEHGSIQSEWTMRIDADEYLDDKLIDSIRSAMAQPDPHINGYEINRCIRFLGKDIRHGGMAPIWVLRLWRTGTAICENRWMDEHMVLLSGSSSRLKGILTDENLNDLSWWTQKHNGYSSREALEILMQYFKINNHSRESIEPLSRQARIKRLMKNYLYYRLPLGLRPWLYFIYRIIFRLGFLDGTRGMIFHTLQGLWYRTLIDAKVKEVQDHISNHHCSPVEAIREVLGIDMAPAAITPPNGLKR